MATETSDGYNDHFRSITVTTIAALAGIAAALLSSAVTPDPSTTEAAAQAARNTRAQQAVAVAILLQPILLRVAGLLKDDFGVKDFLFIAFMTFSMWYVTWGIMLTTGVSL